MAFNCIQCIDEDNPAHLIPGGRDMLKKHVVLSHMKDLLTHQCTKCSKKFYDDEHFFRHTQKDKCPLQALRVIELEPYMKKALQEVLDQTINAPVNADARAAEGVSHLPMTPISNVSSSTPAPSAMTPISIASATPTPSIKEEKMDTTERVQQKKKPKPEPEIEISDDENDEEEVKPTVTAKTKNTAAVVQPATTSVTRPSEPVANLPKARMSAPGNTSSTRGRGGKRGSRNTRTPASVAKAATAAAVVSTPTSSTRSSPRKGNVKEEPQSNRILTRPRQRTQVRSYRDGHSDESKGNSDDSEEGDSANDVEDSTNEEQHDGNDDDEADDAWETKCQLCLELQNNRPPMYNKREKKQHATVHLQFAPSFAELSINDAQSRPQFKKVMKMCFESGYYESLKRDQEESPMEGTSNE